MKKILSTLLLALTAAFMFATNVKADEELVDLYPQDNPAFADSYGNSHWTMEFNGHRWHTVRRSARHVSKFTGYDSEGDLNVVQEIPGENVPPVFYPSGSGSFIFNDTEHDVVVTSSSGTRKELTDVNNRFWAYFDEEGKLYMYEDEFVNPLHITKEDDAWRLATEAEIDAFIAADEGEKPENMLHTPIRIKTTEDGYLIEPVRLGWFTDVPAKPVEGEEGEFENLTDTIFHDYNSADVVIPAGHTVVSFGEMARVAPVLAWAGEFPFLIAEGFDEPAVFKYNNTDPYFAGIEALDDNPSAELTTIIIGYNAEVITADIIQGVSARYIDEEDDIADDGNRRIFKQTDFEVEVYSGDELLETVVVEFVDGAYTVVEELTAIDSSLFGEEYRLVYKAANPLDETLTVEVEAVVSVGVLPPQIYELDQNGQRIDVQDKRMDLHGYINLYDGIFAHDLENDVDITNSIRITHGNDFNPNYVPFGTHEITVTASWVYKQDFAMTITWGEDEDAVDWVFDDIGNNVDYADPAEASRINTIYTLKSIDKLTTPGFKAQAEAWGRVTMVIDKATGKVLTRLDRFANTTPEVIDENGDVEVLASYNFNEWITEYLTEDTVLLHTHGSDAGGVEKSNRVRSNALPLGTELNITSFDDYIEETVQTTNTFNVIVEDTVEPTISAIQPVYTIYTDAGYTSLSQALLPNVVAEDNNRVSNVVFVGITQAQLTIPGEYNVTAIASDPSANNAQTTFKVNVVQRELPEDVVTEIDDLNDQLKDANEKNAELEGKVSDLEQALADQTAELQEAIDAKSEGTSLVVTIIIAVVTAGLSFGGAVLLLRKP